MATEGNISAKASSAGLIYSGDINNSSQPFSQLNGDMSLKTTEDNLLKNKPVTFSASDKNGTTETALYSTTDTMTDGFVKDAGFGIYYAGEAASRYLDIVFNLKGTADIKKLVLFHHNNVNLTTISYAIYVAETEEQFAEAAPAATYNNTERKQCQIFDFTGMNGIGFLKIRIYEAGGIDGNVDCARILEALLTGDNYQPVNKPMLIYSGNIDNESYELSMTTGWNNAVEDRYNLTTTKTNILANKPVEIKAFNKNGETTFGMLGSADSMTDGNARDQGFGIDYYGEGRYLDITYDLEGKADLSDFALFNYRNTSLSTRKYAVYAAKTKAELDHSDPMILYENKAGNECQIFQILGRTDIRYIRLRILNQGSDDYARIYEIAMYASSYKPADPYETVSDNAAEIKQVPNQLVTKSASVFAMEAGEYKENGTGVVSLLQDGIVGYPSEYYTYDVEFAEKAAPNTIYYDDGKNVYLDIFYDFGSVADITHIQVVNHNNEELRTGHYQIYAANSAKTLYDSENLIEDFKNINKDRRQIFLFGGDKKLQAQYVGIRILDPISTREGGITTVRKDEKGNIINNVYPRLDEFNAYGSYVDTGYLDYLSKLPTVTYFNESSVEGINQTSGDLWKLGSSIITNKIADAKLNGVLSSTVNDDKSELLKMTDGNANAVSHNALYRPTTKDGTNYLDLIYNLGENPYDISGFTFIGLGEVNPSYYTGWYQVYAAIDYDDLFLPENMIYEYNYKTDLLSRGQNVKFKTGTEPRGCFFAVRILNPVTSATEEVYTRISEIAVYGTPAVIEVKPINLADKMPVSAYLSDKYGNKTEVDISNLTVAEVNALTDGDKNTYASIKTENKKLDILYNICSDVYFDSLKLSSVINESKRLKEYKIYASTDANLIWSESSLIYSYKNDKNNAQTNGIDFDENNRLLARYIRISVSDSGQNGVCDIAEFEAIGMDNQKAKNKNLALSIVPSDIVVYVQNCLTGLINFQNISESNLRKFVDNDKKSVVVAQGGYADKSTLNIMMYLGDLRTVNSLSLYFTQKHTDYQPKKVNIYLEETEEEVMSLDAKPFKTLDGLPKDGVFTIDMIPRLARYIRVSIVKGNEELTAYDDMCIAFTEISIMGTSVKGMYSGGKSNSLMKFSDAATGINWAIERIDANDIFSTVSSSKLKVYKPTNWQKQSLFFPPYYKLLNDKIYEIEFFDVTGKKVTNLNGRKVTLNVPIEQSNTGDKVLIGNATDKKQIVLYDTSEVLGASPYVTTSLDQNKGFAFAVTMLCSENDPFWSTIGELEDFGGDGNNGVENPLYPETKDNSPIVFVAWICIIACAFVVGISQKLTVESDAK